MAEAVPGIDLIVGGHDHRLLPEPLTVGSTAIVQARSSGAFLGEVVLAVDAERGGVQSVTGRALALGDLPPPDPAVAAAVARWEGEVSRAVDVPIGAAERDWSAEEAGRFVERVLRERAGADFGFYNDGGVRTGIPAGPVLARRVWMMLPFGNTLSTVTIRGEDVGGALLAVLRRDGVPIRADSLYTVATNSFVCERPSAFLGQPQGIEPTEELIRDIVIDHVRARGFH